MRLTFSMLLAIASATILRAEVSSTNSPFALPPGVKIVAHDDSGKTWRQSGVVTGAVTDVRHAFSNAVVQSGFRCRHVISLDEKRGNVLEAWWRKDVQLMLMFWPVDGGKTMFSWGTCHE